MMLDKVCKVVIVSRVEEVSKTAKDSSGNPIKRVSKKEAITGLWRDSDNMKFYLGKHGDDVKEIKESEAISLVRAHHKAKGWNTGHKSVLKFLSQHIQELKLK